MLARSLETFCVMERLTKRQSGTTWDMVCNWVNSHSVGTMFKTRDYLCELKDAPVRPWAHNQHYGPNYRLHQYKGYLRRLGFIKNTSYGQWEVLKPIPQWFNLGHAEFLFTYNNNETYNGLTRSEVKELI